MNGRHLTAQRRGWMREYEENLVALAPDQRGKIDWDTAYHFFNIKLDPREAAVRFVTNTLGRNVQ